MLREMSVCYLLLRGRYTYPAPKIVTLVIVIEVDLVLVNRDSSVSLVRRRSTCN